MLLSVMSVDELLLQRNSLWVLSKQFALLTKWTLGTLLVRKWAMQIYGLCKFSEPFLLKPKLIWGSYSTMYLAYSNIKTGLAQSSCHSGGKVKDLEGSLSYRAEVLHFFSSLPSHSISCLFVCCLSFCLILQPIQLDYFHGTRRSGFSCHGHTSWEEIWADVVDPWLWGDRDQQSKCIYLDK